MCMAASFRYGDRSVVFAVKVYLDQASEQLQIVWDRLTTRRHTTTAAALELVLPFVLKSLLELLDLWVSQSMLISTAFSPVPRRAFPLP